MISEKQIQVLNHQGIIPGPNESESDFIKRADYCLNLKNKLAEMLGIELPFEESELGSSDILSEAFTKTEPLFDIAPDWIPLFFSKEKLSPWHGGCAWIFQLNDETPQAALFQLHPAFQNRSTYLGIYRRPELIAHEMSHVGRMMYEEPQFEEMLAYRTSSSWFRRWFGPIVQSATESLIFISSIIIVIILDIFLLISHAEALYQWTDWIKIIPIALIVYGLARLFYRHRTFSKCLQNIRKLIKSDNEANGVIYRLTDQEIKDFARWTPDQIAQYAKEDANTSLRWKFISEIYLEKGQKQDRQD